MLRRFATPTGLLALVMTAGAQAQPPTAPPPRPATTPTPLGRWAVGPESRPAPFSVELVAKDGRVEVRWESEASAGSATAVKAVVGNGAVVLTGTAEKPAQLQMTSKGPGRRPGVSVDQTTLTGSRITIYLLGGDVLVDGPVTAEPPAGR